MSSIDHTTQQNDFSDSPSISTNPSTNPSTNLSTNSSTNPPITPSTRPSTYWRSIDQLKQTDAFKSFHTREFQEGQAFLDNPVDRRDFLKLLGGTVAFAGLSGCNFRKPFQKIHPYSKLPEYVTPGKSTYYATTMSINDEAVGLLAQSFEGRPTKIEGNPLHPDSLGPTSLFHQASILSLYDPDRLTHLKRKIGGSMVKTDTAQFDKWMDDLRIQIKSRKGEGVCILTESQHSPTFYKLASKLKRLYPAIQLFRYSPVNQDTIQEGLFSVTGKHIYPNYDFKQADIVVSLQSDFLGEGPQKLRYSNLFSQRRNPDSSRPMNRLYTFESNFSITGAKSDHRIRIKSGDIESALWLIAHSLFRKGLKAPYIHSSIRELIFKGSVHHFDKVDPKMIDAIVHDLYTHRGKSLIISGPQQPSSVHGLTFLINHALGNHGYTVSYSPVDYQQYSFNSISHLNSIASLSNELKNKSVSTLFILGCNPCYHAPSNLNFSSLLKNATDVIHLTDYENETSRHCNWVIPQSHYLESWGDVLSLSGAKSIVQPLIKPLYNSYSIIELLTLLRGKKQSGYSLVRSTQKGSLKSVTFNRRWKKWLHDGVISAESKRYRKLKYIDSGFKKLFRSQFIKKSKTSSIEVVFYPDYSVYDGRFSNNGWLQELSDPITKLTWDNAALMSPKTATKLDIKHEDFIELSSIQQPKNQSKDQSYDSSLKIPVYILPGHADNSISLTLGYGKNDNTQIGHGVGFNVTPLRQTHSMHIIPAITVRKLSETYAFSSTQNQGSLEGRPIYRETPLSHYQKNPLFAQDLGTKHPPLASLWKSKVYDSGYQWGMSIDLNKCTGCNACIVACYAENNIPIVGKDQIAKGRGMQWIRIDRYFSGSKEDPKIVHQPMTCLQCENAPCEQVCPVSATVHDDEGLNTMTYNRCIGTRYCADNCPAKVRRFNYFDYHQRNPQSVKKDRKHFFDLLKEPSKTVQMQFNPNVTVRMRGVMEKCSFCIQRIKTGTQSVSNQNRLLIDGEIQTACQQACPTSAIIFGDILDKNSHVRRQKETNRNYNILEELNIRPRTSYLAAVTNPNLDLQPKQSDDHHKKDVTHEKY